MGDWVDKYEPVVEVNTDKVDVEVPSPDAGYLREILVSEGMTVAVGEVLAVLEEAEAGAEKEAPAGVAPPPAAEAPAATRPRATPRVRKLARDHGVDLARVTGQRARAVASPRRTYRPISPPGSRRGLPPSLRKRSARSRRWRSSQSRPSAAPSLSA